MARISVVCADDHPIVLKGVLGLLAEEGDIEVRSACADGIAARDAVLAHEPDLALLDIGMPGMSGIEVLAEIRRAGLKTRVIFLTASANDADILATVAGGARGMILKEMAADDLVVCVRAVAAGGRWLPRELMVRALETGTEATVAGEEACRRLTAREREITLLVASGLSNKGVALRLDLTEGTVKIHLHRIYRKTGVQSRTALVALALTFRDSLIRA